MSLNLKQLFTHNEIVKLPIWGNAADVPQGAILRKGTTPATQNGALIQMTGDAGVDYVGRLAQMLDYSADGETLVNGTSFVLKPVQLLAPTKIHMMEYDLTSVIDATQAVSTTTITLTSLEDDIDAAFLYVAAGLGAGQMNYLTASAAGSATLKAAFGTSLDTTSDIVKVLPRFHQLIELNSDGTKLGSGANAPTGTGFVWDTFIERNGKIDRLSPVSHAALTGLSSLRSFKIWAAISFRNTQPYTID